MTGKWFNGNWLHLAAIVTALLNYRCVVHVCCLTAVASARLPISPSVVCPPAVSPHDYAASRMHGAN